MMVTHYDMLSGEVIEDSAPAPSSATHTRCERPALRLMTVEEAVRDQARHRRYTELLAARPLTPRA